MPPVKKLKATSSVIQDTDGRLNEVSEPTESEDDLSTIDPNILGQAVVFGTDWTAATLIDDFGEAIDQTRSHFPAARCMERRGRADSLSPSCSALPTHR